MKNLNFILMFVVMMHTSYALQSSEERYVTSEENVCKLLSSKVSSSREDIRKSVLFALEIFRKQWKENQIRQLTDTLYYIENSPTFRINHKFILSILSHESEMDIFSKNYNKDGTIDYGLGQHNSKYYKERFRKAIFIHNKEKATNYPVSYWEYNIVINTISTAIFLKSLESSLLRIGKERGICFTEENLLTAYNSGLSGFLRSKIRPEYSKDVMIVYSALNTL